MKLGPVSAAAFARYDCLQTGGTPYRMEFRPPSRIHFFVTGMEPRRDEPIVHLATVVPIDRSETSILELLASRPCTTSLRDFKAEEVKAIDSLRHRTSIGDEGWRPEAVTIDYSLQLPPAPIYPTAPMGMHHPFLIQGISIPWWIRVPLMIVAQCAEVWEQFLYFMGRRP